MPSRWSWIEIPLRILGLVIQIYLKGLEGSKQFLYKKTQWHFLHRNGNLFPNQDCHLNPMYVLWVGYKHNKC